MRKTMVVLAMFVAIVAWLSITGVASAAPPIVLEDTAPMDGIPAEPPAGGAPLAVAQFDPALGVLQSVDVRFDVTLDGTMGAVSTQVDDAVINLELTLESWLHPGALVCPAIPDGTGSLLGVPLSDDQTTPLPGMGSVGPFPVDETGFDSTTLTLPGDMAPFIGTGDVDFTACFLAGIAVQGIQSGNVDLSFTADAVVKVTVTYNYIAVSIDIEKSTNDEDADAPTGPLVPVGGAVTWKYVVKNDGETDLDDVAVTDDQLGPVTCPQTTLAVDESMMCTVVGIAAPDQYANKATATGEAVGTDFVVMDMDMSHYFGWFSTIEIEKSTNGFDADSPTGPSIAVGDDVNWLYEVTNTGNVPINTIAVTDDELGPIACPMDTLAAGASMDCTAMGIATEGQYDNLATVTGQPVDFLDQPLGGPVMDDDPSHYIGVTECIPKKDKPKPGGYPKPNPKKHPKGTKYIKFKKLLYVVFWKGAKRYVEIGGHRYGVTMAGGKPVIKIGSKRYGVKTLKRTRKLALGTPPPLPPCPKDDKSGKPKKDDKPTYGKGKDGGKLVAPTAPPVAETQTGAVIEPVEQQHVASCLGNKRYWLKGAGKNDGVWTRIGPKGKQTRFFAAKQSYVKMLRKGSKRPYFKLAKAYIITKLNVLGGAPSTAKMDRSLVWAEKHFSSHRAGYTSKKRLLAAQSAGGSKSQVRTIKRLKKKMLRHARILRKHDGMPVCAT